MAKSDEITNVGKMTISKSNLSDGIELNQYHNYCDISTIASFSRAILTAEGGYLVKKFSNGFAHLNTNEERGSDCGTKYTFRVKITDKNADQFYLRYALYNKKLVLLDKNNLQDAVGKTLEIRSPMFCKDSKVCNMCIGDLYHNLGVSRLGNLPSKLGSAHLNKALKKFHDLSIKNTRIEVLDSFREI